MKKKHDIVMVASENASYLHLVDGHPKLLNSVVGKVRKGGQHLYILSDEDVKEGDAKLFLYEGKAYLSSTSDRFKDFDMSKAKHIIASTDTSLPFNAPIPQHIIEAYVEKPFDKVVVEYDRYINVPEGVTVRFNDELPKALGGCEGCSGTVIWGVKDTPIFISSCLKVSFVNNYGVKTEKYANAAHWSDSLKEFYYDTPKLNPDGILAVSLVEEKMIPLSNVTTLMVKFSNDLANWKLPKGSVADWINEWIKENL